MQDDAGNARDVFLYSRSLMVAGPQALEPETLPAIRLDGAPPRVCPPARASLLPRIVGSEQHNQLQNGAPPPAQARMLGASVAPAGFGSGA